MARVHQQMCFLLLVALAMVYLFYWVGTSQIQLSPAFKLPSLFCSMDDDIDRGVVLDALRQLRNTLKEENDSIAAMQQTSKLINILNREEEQDDKSEADYQEDATDWFQRLNSTNMPTNTTENRNKTLLEVCPEEWVSCNSAHPFCFTNWRIINCSNAVPFEKVITVILYNQPKQEDGCPQEFLNVLTGIKKLYPKISVLVSGVSEDCVATYGSSQVLWISKANNSKPGRVWNRMVKHVSTPYVLVGRDMDDFLWTTNLERQIRVLSDSAISVAGGAVRNSTGHWKVGCLQATMRNYILEYQEGYYTSENSCLFCDHLLGPFVVRTKIVKSIKFDVSLTSDVLFEDWFWRLKQKSHKIINCPDVMYLTSDTSAMEKSVSRTPWLPLAHKWHLNRIVVPHKHTFSYTCTEAGLSCKRIFSLTDSFLMPICCVEQFAAAIGIFDDFCRQHDLYYEIQAGSALGVVKMNDLMPWDLDGDFNFYTANLSYFKSNYDHFRRHGIILRDFKDKGNQISYFSVYTPDLYMEMWGKPKLARDFPLGKPFFSLPTLVELHGHWVYAPYSPGTYTRNRYGIEIFRHAQSWMKLGMKSSWVPYKSGHFKKCAVPTHHACLDHFSPDGNIQFQVPN